VADYAQAEAMVRRAGEAFGGVDILVNVAGVILPAPISEADPAGWRRMVDVNPMRVLHATRAALPGMIRRGNGHVMNVSSTSGRTHQPLSPVYAATKHGLGAFTEVLRKEVHPNRIRATLFEPGPTKSELGFHADSEVMRGMADDFSGVEFLKVEDVAQGILWTLAQPDRINVNEVLFRPTDQQDW
jgi:NADP-dependent 3-hydroxy acid dehydrogenase YdfG